MVKARIRFKIIVISVLFLALLILVLYPVTTVFMMQNYNELEDNQVERDMLIFRQDLDNQKTYYHRNTKEFTSDDDLYQFAGTNNDTLKEEFISKKLTFEVFERLQSNFMVILNNRSDVLFKQAYDLLFEFEDIWPSEMDEHLEHSDEMFPFYNTRSEKEGYLDLNGNVYMISARPILTHRDEGPLRGIVIFGREIDINVIFDFPIVNNTGLKLDLVRFNADYIPADFEDIIVERDHEKDELKIKNLS
jgi:sensor domain CHASE-containing protein